MRSQPLSQVARALDEVCASAEQAEADARELLIAVVDLLAEREEEKFFQRLREEAVGSSLLSLGRLLRRPVTTSMRPPAPGAEGRVPDYGTGRTLTLGERKALARRPTRKAMEKLFADPHPAVIRTLLANPKVVEARRHPARRPPAQPTRSARRDCAKPALGAPRSRENVGGSEPRLPARARRFRCSRFSSAPSSSKSRRLLTWRRRCAWRLAISWRAAHRCERRRQK